jgi:branched-chain amino acid transport system ATP-binding protein
MLELNNVNARYGELQALWEVSLQVHEGELVALIGPNGAGKTSALRVITGLLKPSSGSVRFRGTDLTKVAAHRVVELGVSLVPEGGSVFTSMTVLENLELGAFVRQARKSKDKNLSWVFGIFPRLEERQAQRAGTLSGGERQMLAIARALMSRPSLLMLDEPSFGLAPILVEQVFDLIKDINRQGVTILLVEQNVRAALELAHRAFVLENGRIVGQGAGDNLLSFESVRRAYLA